MNMVRQKEADALVSAGSSGAILVGGQVIVKDQRGRTAAALHRFYLQKKGFSG